MVLNEDAETRRRVKTLGSGCGLICRDLRGSREKINIGGRALQGEDKDALGMNPSATDFDDVESFRPFMCL